MPKYIQGNIGSKNNIARGLNFGIISKNIKI